MISKRALETGLECLLFLAICFATAAIGSLFAGSEWGEWYRQIEKPVFTPPGWVFGPVWTFLYLAMGIAAWIVWRKRHERPVTLPLSVFAVQLALNGLWTPLFFGMRNPGIAFLDIVALWLAIAATIWWFSSVSKQAAYLLVPYLVWVSFALILNLEIWRLNSL
jgi:tryptophan-rich sensory protein